MNKIITTFPIFVVLGLFVVVSVFSPHVYAANNISIISPNGGESLPVGKTITVKWNGGDFPFVIALASPNFSTDGKIFGYLGANAQSREIKWNVSSLSDLDGKPLPSWEMASGQYRILVIAKSANGNFCSSGNNKENCNFAVSSNTFSITGGTNEQTNNEVLPKKETQNVANTVEKPVVQNTSFFTSVVSVLNSFVDQVGEKISTIRKNIISFFGGSSNSDSVSDSQNRNSETSGTPATVGDVPANNSSGKNSTSDAKQTTQNVNINSSETNSSGAADPTGLKGEFVSPLSVLLTWNPIHTSGYKGGYNIYKNGSLFARTRTDLVNEKSYYPTVYYDNSVRCPSTQRYQVELFAYDDNWRIVPSGNLSHVATVVGSSCPNPTISVVSPKSGEKYKTGETVFIQWKTTWLGNYGNSVALNVYKAKSNNDYYGIKPDFGDTTNNTIENGKTLDTGEYQWTIPSTFTPGTYVVSISAYPGISANSASFTIQ